jgi:tripartite-type tricarboxylate transporter receptor subunit TctC
VLVLAPAGTPHAIVERLSTEVAKVVKDPEIQKRFTQLGIEPVGSTPEEAGKFLQDEVAKWAKVIQAAGVKAE